MNSKPTSLDPYAPPNAPPRRAPPRSVRGWFGVVAIIVMVPIVLFAILIGYVVLKMRWATKTAHAFCDDDVAIGAPVAGLEEKAKARGLWVLSGGSGDALHPAHITAGEGFVFARVFCTVEYEDGVVTKKSIGSLD
jgi:hypothetical protein